MKNRNKINIMQLGFSLVLILVFAILGYDLNGKIDSRIPNDVNINTIYGTNDNVNNKNSGNDLKIHYIDVGQGDATIIEQNGHYMLIDAGTNDCENDLITYIDNLNITKIDYVIATHAHEDHIGSMDTVISKYEVGKILFPKHTTTTKTFENFVKAVKNKNLKLYAPSVNEEFVFEDSKFIVLAPNKDNYEEINNYSIVIKFIYKDTSYLFTGDAETLSEQEMLNNNLDISADVLKVGHHGSNSSTSQNFLNEVKPKYAVISVAKYNDYNHPKKTVMNRLKNNNIKVYRTDESGTIVLTSDGKTIAFDKKVGSYNGK